MPFCAVRCSVNAGADARIAGRPHLNYRSFLTAGDFGPLPDNATTKSQKQLDFIIPFGYIGNYVVAQSAPYGITSAYRNPAAEVSAATNNHTKPAPNSRHEAGDGADLRTNWGGTSIFDTIYGAASAANSGACFEPGYAESYSHVHVDWRSQTGPNNNWGGTADFPNPSSDTSNGCPYGWEYH
jgi:hypothetical protein